MTIKSDKQTSGNAKSYACRKKTLTVKQGKLMTVLKLFLNAWENKKEFTRYKEVYRIGG